MDFVFQTLHFKASEHLETFSQKKLNRIFRMLTDILHAQLTLSEGAAGNIENQICEIILKTSDQTIVVKKKASTFEQAISKSVESVQKIIRRRKTQKQKDRHIGAIAPLENLVEDLKI